MFRSADHHEARYKLITIIIIIIKSHPLTNPVTLVFIRQYMSSAAPLCNKTTNNKCDSEQHHLSD